MQSYLKLQLESYVQKDISTPNQFPHFSSWRIPHALARILSLTHGEGVHQLLSKYLVHIDLFEFQLTDQECINFIKEKKAIIMFMILEGEAKLFDKTGQFITAIKAPSYHLAYIPQGNYTLKLDAASHKLITLTPKPEWFIDISKNFDQFKQLKDHYRSCSSDLLSLPHCSLKKGLLHSFSKALSKLSTDNDENFPISNFLSSLIRHYGEMLAFNNHTTNAVHQAKAKVLSSYVNQHFTNDKLVSFAHLMEQLAMSDGTLKDVARIAFNKALKSHVIDLRMGFAMDLIISTDKKIREIAILSGYRDAHYFSRAFKLYYSKSPKNFRPKIRSVF